LGDKKLLDGLIGEVFSLPRYTLRPPPQKAGHIPVVVRLLLQKLANKLVLGVLVEQSQGVGYRFTVACVDRCKDGCAKAIDHSNSGAQGPPTSSTMMSLS
jgi:hypothetical protein